MNSRKTRTDISSGVSATASSSSAIDWFESIGNHAVWIVLALASLMAAFVYWDFLTGAKVLLYKDIGSDSINMFYPLYMQSAKSFAKFGTEASFSLEIVMGSVTGMSKYDIFSWMMVWNGPDNVITNITYVEIVKLLAASALGYFYFRYQQFSNITSVIGALCLGFSGYIALGASGWHASSAQAFYMVGLLWLAEYGLTKKPFYYILVPLLLAYIAHMTGYLIVYFVAALIVYVPLRNFTSQNTRDALKSSATMIGLLLVGLALSYNVLTGIVSMVTSSGRAESIKQTGAASAYGTKMDVSMFDLAPRAEYSNIVLRAYSNNTMGTGNGFRGMMNYLEAPLLYCGLAMLMFLPFFFVGQDKRTRLAYGAMLGGVVMMLIFPWFRFAFWGFNLDYFREFTMLIGVVLLIIAMRGLNTFITTPNKTYRWLAPTAALVLTVLPFTFAKPASLIDPSQKSTLILLLLGFSAVTIAYTFTRRKEILIGLLLVTTIDLALNANTTINKRDLLTTREIEQGALYGGASQKAIDWLNSQNTSLFRLAKFNPGGPTIHTSLNDAMVQGFNGIIGYSSFHNKYYLRAMEAFGCRDPKNPSEAKWVIKAITRPYLASALGVKYFLVNDKPMGFNDVLFPPIKQIDNVFVHESKTALPLLVAYDSYITEDEFRAQTNGRNDYMLFKAAIIDPTTSNTRELPHYNLNADTLRAVGPIDFAQAADERKALMSVETKTTQTGITANVDLKRDALVVITIPYSEGIKVLIDGKPTENILANFGFIGVYTRAGTKRIELQYF